MHPGFPESSYSPGRPTSDPAPRVDRLRFALPVRSVGDTTDRAMGASFYKVWAGVRQTALSLNQACAPAALFTAADAGHGVGAPAGAWSGKPMRLLTALLGGLLLLPAGNATSQEAQPPEAAAAAAGLGGVIQLRPDGDGQFRQAATGSEPAGSVALPTVALPSVARPLVDRPSVDLRSVDLRSVAVPSAAWGTPSAAQPPSSAETAAPLPASGVSDGAPTGTAPSPAAELIQLPSNATEFPPADSRTAPPQPPLTGVADQPSPPPGSQAWSPSGPSTPRANQAAKPSPTGTGPNPEPGVMVPGASRPNDDQSIHRTTPDSPTAGAPGSAAEISAASRRELVLDRSRRELVVVENGTPLRRFPVAVGMPGWETPVGRFAVIEMQSNPTWEHPASGLLIKPGPDNPLGSRWIGFHRDCSGRRGFNGQEHLVVEGCVVAGFHGTPNRTSIGQAVSHGCVRLFDEHVRDLFDLVRLGTPVTVLP